MKKISKDLKLLFDIFFFSTKESLVEGNKKREWERERENNQNIDHWLKPVRFSNAVIKL